jgi:hypothetical protein
MSGTTQWRMPSNDGRAIVVFDALFFHPPIAQIEFRIALLGKHWYRPALFADPPEYDRMVDDFGITLPSVLVPKSACDELLGDFNAWLDTHQPFALTLCPGPDQKMTVAVGAREGHLSTLDHPIFSCDYTAGCQLAVAFAVDQSCVRIARDGLSRVLESLVGM